MINIQIAHADNMRQKVWKNISTTWEAFAAAMSQTKRTLETVAQYRAADKEAQLAIKDVGGYVGGYLINGRRSPVTSVLYRSILTLDIDTADYYFWSTFTSIFDCAALVHSTHKHTPENPRFRLVLPFSRNVAIDEYQAVARKVAELIGLHYFDSTTFEVNRLMFYPSTSSDGEYYFMQQQGEPLDVDTLLSFYVDWHDVTQWAYHNADSSKAHTAALKQKDPCEKPGIIGAFCRTYGIHEAIAAFLSDKYVSASIPDRYTYIDSTTAAGLVVYDNTFAYSHHSTDPAGGLCLNAFDLVRVHKFSHLDTGSDKTGVNLPSFKAMESFALSDGATKSRLFTERQEQLNTEFGAVVGVPDTVATQPAQGSPEPVFNPTQPVQVNVNSLAWTSQLETDRHGDVLPTSRNINIILKNDEHLQGRFAYNTFDNRRYLLKSVFWRAVNFPVPMIDTDYSGIRNYIDSTYRVASSQKIEDSLALAIYDNKFHPVREYLESVWWDGVPRLDYLLVDYFGAMDNQYTREAIRKTLIAACARIYEPGKKFDTMLTLVGAQGSKKSSFFAKLAGRWFSDTLNTVQGKEAYEALIGKWIVEVAELSAMRRADVEATKHFVSKQVDSFRPAYGRTTEDFPRQCVFVGSTNEQHFLRDTTGNRRYFPVDVDPEAAVKDVWQHLDEEVGFIWGEAMHRYKSGESLLLSPEAEALANLARYEHSEVDDRSGLVVEFLNTLRPEGWESMSIDARRRWVLSPELRETGTKKITKICAAEIFCELFGRDIDQLTKQYAREINDILRMLPGWKASTQAGIIPGYGRQRYFKRKM